jgi:hypothetical protein
MSTAQGHSESSGEKDNGSNAVRLAIPLGVGLIIGLFTSIGLQGEALQRVIRNTPSSVSTILTVAVIGVGVPALILILRYYLPENWWNHIVTRILVGLVVIVGSVLLLIASINALRVGTTGIAERENPGLKLELSPREEALTLTVHAVAPTLSSDEKMLLRVSALSENVEGQAASDACRTTVIGSSRDAHVLAYVETGPGRDGNAVDSVTVTVPASANAVCAYAILYDRDKLAAEDDRDTWAMVNRSGFPAVDSQ